MQAEGEARGPEDPGAPGRERTGPSIKKLLAQRHQNSPVNNVPEHIAQIYVYVNEVAI